VPQTGREGEGGSGGDLAKKPAAGNGISGHGAGGG
jgi:hypothetical protein